MNQITIEMVFRPDESGSYHVQVFTVDNPANSHIKHFKSYARAYKWMQNFIETAEIEELRANLEALQKLSS